MNVVNTNAQVLWYQEDGGLVWGLAHNLQILPEDWDHVAYLRDHVPCQVRVCARGCIVCVPVFGHFVFLEARIGCRQAC